MWPRLRPGMRDGSEPLHFITTYADIFHEGSCMAEPLLGIGDEGLVICDFELPIANH